MRSVPIILFLLMVTVVVSPAQDDLMSGIAFPAIPPDIVILLDGEIINPHAGDTVMVRPGRHLVEEVVGDRLRWTIHRVVDTLDLLPGQVVTARSGAGAEHLITSNPEGASVYRNGTLLGTTPFRYRHDDPTEGTVSLRKEGFEPKVIAPALSHEHVFLIPESPQVTPGPEAMRTIKPAINNQAWTISSAVVMVGSSIAAAYLKEKANRALDEYRRTGSTTALDRVRRYDNYSAVAAATMVVSFSGFAFFLTTE